MSCWEDKAGMEKKINDFIIRNILWNLFWKFNAGQDLEIISRFVFFFSKVVWKSFKNKNRNIKPLWHIIPIFFIPQPCWRISIVPKYTHHSTNQLNAFFHPISEYIPRTILQVYQSLEFFWKKKFFQSIASTSHQLIFNSLTW